jgi:hypothetical protein
VVVGVAVPVARYVAKWVPGVDRAALQAGARASQIITRGGLAAGEPVVTRDASITVDFTGGVVATAHRREMRIHLVGGCQAHSA